MCVRDIKAILVLFSLKLVLYMWPPDPASGGLSQGSDISESDYVSVNIWQCVFSFILFSLNVVTTRYSYASTPAFTFKPPRTCGVDLIFLVGMPQLKFW